MKNKPVTLKLFNRFRYPQQTSRNRLRNLVIGPIVLENIVDIAKTNILFSLFVVCWVHGASNTNNFILQPDSATINTIALKLKEK